MAVIAESIPKAGPLAPVSKDPALAVTQARVIRSEWIKLRSVRSWWIMAVSAFLLLIAFGALAASVASGTVSQPNGGGGGGFASTDPTSISLAGVTLAQLIVGVLGVLFISNEYANGMIATLVTFLLGQGILGDGKNTTLGADNVLRAVIGAGFYLAGIGVFGIAVGALMRNTAVAISIVVAALLIVPGLARLMLPDAWHTTLSPYLIRRGKGVGAHHIRARRVRLPSAAVRRKWLPRQRGWSRRVAGRDPADRPRRLPALSDRDQSVDRNLSRSTATL